MLKRKRDQLELDDAAYVAARQQWLTLVLRYARDAPRELWAIYSSLSHWPSPVPLPRDCCLRFTSSYPSRGLDVLGTPAHTHVFLRDSCIVYGPNAERWPLLDQSLWPWTATRLPLPSLPKDVWGVICRHLSIRDALTLSLVSRRVRDCVLRDEHWLWRLQAIERAVPHFGTMLPPTTALWQRFAHLQQMSRRPPSHHAATRLGIHLMFPRCFARVEPWRDCKRGDPPPPGLNRFYVWRRYIGFYGPGGAAAGYAVVVGQVNRKRKFTVYMGDRGATLSQGAFIQRLVHVATHAGPDVAEMLTTTCPFRSWHQFEQLQAASSKL